MLRPLIGITTHRHISEETGWEYDMNYAQNARAIEAAGGLPVLIPAALSQDTLRALYERLDGLMLPGGGDVDPVHYQQEAHPTVNRIDEDRDRTEMTLTRWAVADDLPLFGICRGVQVMNVALGGTLVQDIPSQVQTDLKHDIPNDQPRSTRLHEVVINEGSRLARILGTTRTEVNSLHHQAVGAIAPSAQATAHAPDGVIEALELPDKYFVLAVQWHPEDMIDDNEAMRRIFVEFVEAARRRMVTKLA
ncbi:MAG: gamma-glutamyl-gamma-aminobutyrate hydrolase family protein [Anaerolineae bacterium]|nr:gamma-glutamyl-gamma-aminobutyrate hydrolase family protein [Anaerolineae bacterium]MDW8172836.1 gamma-glutamyl-gamma-aminobutyrate hydrolase family protein [Anaerolineae bacterium]